MVWDDDHTIFVSGWRLAFQKGNNHSCCMCRQAAKQWGAQGPVTTRFGSLSWKRAIETNSIFLAFALFTNIQVEHSRGGQMALLQHQLSVQPHAPTRSGPSRRESTCGAVTLCWSISFQVHSTNACSFLFETHMSFFPLSPPPPAPHSRRWGLLLFFSLLQNSCSFTNN